MIEGWIVACRRVIIRVAVRRRNRPPHVLRFHADRWHRFRVYVAAAGMQMQQVDSIPLAYTNQPTLLALRSNVEGVRFWKVDQATPLVGSAVVTPIRTLRPFEVTTDMKWSLNSRPAIVISNPTARAAVVDVVYGTREVGGSGGVEDF